MAWYYGTYSCGHEGRINIIGPQKDRQWKIDRRFEGLCPECYKKKMEEEREKANKEAAEKSSELELPELSGSEKQVAWANTLRLKIFDGYEKTIETFNERICRRKRYLKELEEKGIPNDKKLEDVKFFVINVRNERVYTSKEEVSDSLDYAIQRHTDAKFWIDSRFYSGSEILADFILEYREFQKENDIPDDIKEEIEEETKQLSVIPESDCLKSGIVEIEYKDNILSAKYIKDKDFIKIVKSLNYKWNGAIWSKEITEYTGLADDRAAELGNKLLTLGFVVKFPNKKSKDKAVSADFELENDRWIVYNENEKLSIIWEKRSDTLYKAARKLPSAKWSNGSMKINIEFYKEVEDFADTMRFSISNMARKKIEEYKKKESSFEKADVSVKIKVVMSDKERIEKYLKSNGTIIKDLVDE